MKLLSLAYLMLPISFSAIAATSSYIMNCSNATGTVVWEEGHTENVIKLTYKGFVTGALELPMDQVNITMSEQKTISETSYRMCYYGTSTRTFSAKVVITPATEYPDVFQSYFPKNEISTTVLCERHTRSEQACASEL